MCVDDDCSYITVVMHDTITQTMMAAVTVAAILVTAHIVIMTMVVAHRRKTVSSIYR